MPRKGKCNAEEAAEEHQADYIKFRHAHSAVESNINSLEHHGLDRCPDKGYNGYTLHRPGRHRLQPPPNRERHFTSGARGQRKGSQETATTDQTKSRLARISCQTPCASKAPSANQGGEISAPLQCENLVSMGAVGHINSKNSGSNTTKPTDLYLTILLALAKIRKSPHFFPDTIYA